jgi:hypothetical protein
MSNIANPGARSQSAVFAPHLRQTKYDITVSALATAAMFAGMTLIAMICMWFPDFVPTDRTTPVSSLHSIDDGLPNGDTNNSLNVESPGDISLDPSLANEESDVTQLEEVVEQVVEVSVAAATIVAPDESSGSMTSAPRRSAKGSGNSPISSRKNSDPRGSERERRWIVEFADKGDLKNYAAQLDFFSIELGAMFPAEGRLVYLSNLGSESPDTREIREDSGHIEQRMFTQWTTGSSERRMVDVELFQRVGIDASNAVIMHFYTSETENLMARIEQEFGGHTPDEIRRTYFRVRKTGNGYEFYVHKQLLK